MKKYVNSKYEDLKKEEELSKEPIISDAEEEARQQQVSDEIRASFENYFDFFGYSIYPEYIRIYKHKRLYTGDRYLKLKEANLTDKSNIKYPLITSIHDTYYSNTFDAQTSIRAVPTERTDLPKTKAAQSYVERAFSTSDWDSIIKMMDFEASLIWPWYAKVWYIDVSKELPYLKDWVEVSEKYEKKKPTISYVDAFSLCYNPFASSFYTAQKFYRNIIPLAEVKEMYSWIVELSDEQRKTVTDEPKYFSDIDYKRVRVLKWMESKIKDCSEDCEMNQTDVPSMSFTDTDVFNVDYNNSTIEVVEYRDPLLSRFVLHFNWHMAYDWPSPRPFEWDPFVRVCFQEQPWSLFPVWIWQKLESIQNNVDAFVNSRIDTVNQYANPAFIADKWVFWADTREVLNVRPWKVYERVLNKYIEVMKTVDPQAVTSLLNWIQFYISQAYEIAGLNVYTQWGQWKIERTAWWVNQRVQVLKTALVPFFNNKNQTLSKISDKWMAIGRTFLWDKFTVRLLGPEDAVSFIEIKAEDLANKIDFAYDNQSLRSITRKEERSDIIDSLQYAQDPMTRMVLEKKLLETFDFEVPTFDQRKKEAHEQFELNTIVQTGQEPSQQQPQATSAWQPQQNIPGMWAQWAQSVPSVPQWDTLENVEAGAMPSLGRPKIQL